MGRWNALSATRFLPGRRVEPGLWTGLGVEAGKTRPEAGFHPKQLKRVIRDRRGQPSEKRVGVNAFHPGHSNRSASIGSSEAAFQAG